MDFAIIPGDATLRGDDPMWDQIVGALNIYASQHVAAVWGTPATVNQYSDSVSVPPGYVPILVSRNPPIGTEGCHYWKDGQASAVIRWLANGAWSVAASHEMAEILVDPTLQRTVQGPDPTGGGSTVEFLVEICDPCGQVTYLVTPGSSVNVSDFCLPAYYAQSGYGPFTRCGQQINLWEINTLVNDEGYITWQSDAGYFQLVNGLPQGPYSQQEVLVGADKLGVRGVVDRFSKFSKPSYLRPKNKARRTSKRKGLKSWPGNIELDNWVKAFAG